MMNDNMTDEQLDAIDAQLVAEWLKTNKVTECEAFERTDPDNITWRRSKGLKRQERTPPSKKS